MRIMLAIWMLLAVSVANAFEIVSVNNVEVQVSYTEPTENSDNSPLTDLKEIIIYYTVNGGVEQEAARIPATSPTGGGNVSQAVPIPIGEGQEADVVFFGRAVDGSGNMSGNSNTVVLRIDRLAPKPPQ